MGEGATGGAIEFEAFKARDTGRISFDEDTDGARAGGLVIHFGRGGFDLVGGSSTHRVHDSGGAAVAASSDIAGEGRDP